MVTSDTFLKEAPSGINLMRRMNRMMVDSRKWCAYSGCKKDTMKEMCVRVLIQQRIETKKATDFANSLYRAH